jgi:hypothetical protein
MIKNNSVRPLGSSERWRKDQHPRARCTSSLYLQEPTGKGYSAQKPRATFGYGSRVGQPVYTFSFVLSPKSDRQG